MKKHVDIADGNGVSKRFAMSVLALFHNIQCLPKNFQIGDYADGHSFYVVFPLHKFRKTLFVNHLLCKHPKKSFNCFANIKHTPCSS